MKLIILCALFAPIIYLALRQKKWYLYLLFAFVGFLPEQFSISVHESLPLLSATRILILILLGFWIYDKWKRKNFSFPKSLIIYLIVNVIISLVNLRFGTSEINRIFRFVFERVLMVIMIADMIDTREEFEKGIDFLILGCMAVSVIAIIQTVFKYDISSVLHLQVTMASKSIANRMGLIRAYGTMNAISFGCYCAFMCLPIYYRLEQTGKQRYAIAFAVNFVALICTFTRSAWLCIAGILFLLLIFRRMKFIRKMLTSAGYIILICGILCCIQPRLYDALVETGKSSINTVLGVLPDSLWRGFESTGTHNPDSTDSSDASVDATESPTEETTESDFKPGFELSEDFGLNANDPTYSRTVQWSAVTHMIKEGNALFGCGYDAFIDGRLYFFYDRWGNQWTVAKYLDVGWVASATEGGFIGMAAHILLLAYMLIQAFRKRDRSGEFDFFKMMIYIIPLYVLLNILASFLNGNSVWLLFGLFYAYEKLHREGKLALQAPAEPVQVNEIAETADPQAPQQPMVSIYVPVYNHEKYVVRALDSIRMQKTQYEYEVFVGEDCSTDNTRQVLKTWEEEHQDPRFHIFYRETNMYGSECSNGLDLKLRCKGKYIICLEGDDFWTDENKLETQVAFLETHPDYYAVAHNCTVVGADDQPNGESYPQCKDEEYTLRHFFSEIMPGQYTTLLSRNYMTDPNLDRTLLQRQGGAGDRRTYFTLLCHGKIHCIQKVMSAYRHITNEGTSYSATFRYNYDKTEDEFRAHLEYAYLLDHPQAIRYTEMVYLRNIRHASRKGLISSQRAKQDRRHIRHRLRASWLLLKRDVNYRILHKKLYV